MTLDTILSCGGALSISKFKSIGQIRCQRGVQDQPIIAADRKNSPRFSTH